MIDTLRAWLNGTREYNIGVEIFAVVSDDIKLLELFRKGLTAYTKWRLSEELTKIYKKLKLQDEKEQVSTSPFVKIPSGSEITGNSSTKEETPSLNPELLESAKKEANNAYKEVMNIRAVLFSMVPSNNFENANRQELIAGRRQMCLDIVKNYNRASELYDQVDFVREHGHLPVADDQPPVADDDYTNIPDHQVKQKLDNLRKNYNKMKNRPKTPERVELLQKHEKNIQYLLKRWQSLQ